jgi:hypothetical protein
VTLAAWLIGTFAVIDLLAFLDRSKDLVMGGLCVYIYHCLVD